MLGLKGTDRSLYEISVFWFVLNYYSTTFNNNYFPLFKNSTTEARLLRNEAVSINCPDLQTFTSLHIVLQVDLSKT